ncbi:hypothetical protein Hanom_Chr08g00728741 [Helianthus anomalus]
MCVFEHPLATLRPPSGVFLGVEAPQNAMVTVPRVFFRFKAWAWPLKRHDFESFENMTVDSTVIKKNLLFFNFIFHSYKPQLNPNFIYFSFVLINPFLIPYKKISCRPPFDVPSRTSNPNLYRPNITQPLRTYSYQDIDPNMMVYTQLLNMPHQYFQGPLGFTSNVNISMGGTHGSQEGAEPEIDTALETQTEREPEGSQREKRSHKKRILPLHVQEEAIKFRHKTKSTRSHGLESKQELSSLGK